MASKYERTITVRIVSEDERVAPSPDANSGAGGSKPKAEADRKNQNGKKFFSAYVTGEVLATAKTIAEAGYSRYVSLTENYVAETSQQNMNAQMGRFFSVAMNTVAGAKLGMMAFGPVGAALGTITGFATSLVRNEIARGRNLAEQARSVHQEAYSLYFNTERAGMINYSRGTEN